MTRILQIKVKPNARASVMEKPDEDGGVWRAQIKAPPVDGKANEELIALVARYFGCAKSSVTIKRGGSGRLKLVAVEMAEG